MKSVIFLIALVYFAGTKAEEVRLVDLDPNEAQQLINSQDQTLKYAPKVESNVPAVRFLGNEPHHVQEDIYLAKQYHGQDGLGGYLYGYQVPDIAKNERKEPSGPLRGAYNYINGDGKEIKVEYWDDGTGFHQIDNVPEVAPKQVEDAPDVAAAKEEFFRRWNEEAERNKHPIVDPNANVNPYSSNTQYQGIQQSQYQQQPSGGSQYFSNPNPLQNQNIHYSGSATTTGQQSVPYPPQGQQLQTPPQKSGLQSGTYYQGSPSNPTQSQPSISPSQGSPTYQTTYSNENQGQAHAPSQAQAVSGATNYHGSSSYQPNQPQVAQYQGQPQQIPQYQGSSSYQSGRPQENQVSVSGSHGCQQNFPCETGSQSAHATSPTPFSNPLSLNQNQGWSSNANKYQSTQNQIDYSGQYSENKNYYAPSQHQDGKNYEEENSEENGPPKGFFYSFEYPVGIIVQKGERALPQGENRNVRDVYEQNKANFEAQLKTGKSSGSQSSYLYVKN